MPVSALGEQLLAQTQAPVKIQVLGTDDSHNGLMQCKQHEVCGANTKPGDLLVVKKIKIEGNDEYGVYRISGTLVGCLIGTLNKKKVISGDLVLNTPYLVTSNLKDSDKLTERRKAAKHRGFLNAVLIADIIEKSNH